MKKIIIAITLLSISFTAYADWAHENISKAVFAKDVIDRTPIDIINDADSNTKKVFFFTNIRNLTGETITHRWLYKDKVMAEVSFAIKGKRWRVWSSKNIWHTWVGEWKVEVVNSNDEILLQKTFNYYK